jgi:hypothetical protein
MLEKTPRLLNFIKFGIVDCSNAKKKGAFDVLYEKSGLRDLRMSIPLYLSKDSGLGSNLNNHYNN